MKVATMDLKKNVGKYELLLKGDTPELVPQKFIEDFKPEDWHIESSDREILSDGPTHEWYNDAWETVLDFAYYIDVEGHTWYLWQDETKTMDLYMHRDDFDYNNDDDEVPFENDDDK